MVEPVEERVCLALPWLIAYYFDYPETRRGADLMPAPLLVVSLPRLTKRSNNYPNNRCNLSQNLPYCPPSRGPISHKPGYYLLSRRLAPLVGLRRTTFYSH